MYKGFTNVSSKDAVKCNIVKPNKHYINDIQYVYFLIKQHFVSVFLY